MAEINKSIEEIEAELDKEFYDKYVELAKKYKRSFAPKLIVARLTEDELNRVK